MTANPELTGRTPVFSWPLAGCAQDSSMNCASTRDGGAVPGDVPADSGGATPRLPGQMPVVVEYSAVRLDLGFWRRHDRHPCLSRWLTGCW